MSNLQEFLDYVWSFYNTEDGLYPIEGITKQMILDASWLYLQMCCYPSMPEYEWGDGDTTDRVDRRQRQMCIRDRLVILTDVLLSINA